MIKVLSKLLILTVFCCTQAVSDTVYKSVNENGVVSFSDLPPADGEDAQKLELVIVRPDTSSDSLVNLEAMRDTTDRMAADRREREKHRAEMRQLQIGKQEQIVSSVDYADEYYPVAVSYDHRRYHKKRSPYRPGLYPKSDQPITRPPMRQPGAGRGSSNSQLMRPIVSSRR